MQHLKRYEVLESKENKEKVLITLSSSNISSPDSWSIGFPGAHDFTEICKRLGDLTNDEYTKQIVDIHFSTNNLPLRKKILNKLRTQVDYNDVTIDRIVSCDKFKKFNIVFKNAIFNALKNSGFIVKNNSYIYKIIDKDNFIEECEFINKLFSMKTYINSNKSEEEVRENNKKIKDILTDIESISYLIEEEGYNYKYKYLVLFDTLKIITDSLDGSYISGVLIEIENASTDFLNRYVNLLKEHLDYIDTDKITIDGNCILISE